MLLFKGCCKQLLTAASDVQSKVHELLGGRGGQPFFNGVVVQGTIDIDRSQRSPIDSSLIQEILCVKLALPRTAMFKHICMIEEHLKPCLNTDSIAP